MSLGSRCLLFVFAHAGISNRMPRFRITNASHTVQTKAQLLTSSFIMMCTNYKIIWTYRIFTHKKNICVVCTLRFFLRFGCQCFCRLIFRCINMLCAHSWLFIKLYFISETTILEWSFGWNERRRNNNNNKKILRKKNERNSGQY